MTPKKLSPERLAEIRIGWLNEVPTVADLLRHIVALEAELADEKQGAEQWVDRCRAAIKEREHAATRLAESRAECERLRALLDEMGTGAI